MSLALDALQCPYCGGRDFDANETRVLCHKCDRKFPVVEGIINTLIELDTEVARELKGMMEESDQKFDSVDDFIVRRVDKISSMEERKNSTRGLSFDYYGSTEMNFLQALENIEIRGDENVLEVGGHDDYPFLVPFKEKGCRCFETNIYFVYDDNEEYRHWPERIVGDMNQLPYRDGFFDIVVVSAATHHSPNLDITIKELARVTKQGGSILIVNEPAGTWFKHSLDCWNTRGSHSRDDLIHENEYSLLHYFRLFRRHGLILEKSLFARYYEEKLSSFDTRGVRFEPVAKMVSRLWRNQTAQKLIKSYGLWFGQVLVGLQMNFVLKKQ